MPDEDEVVLSPPNALRVAKRAIVLASCACRASLEQAPKDAQAKGMHVALKEWLKEIDVRDEFEESEWKGIVSSLGTLSDRIAVNFSWRAEGLAVVAWALGRTTMLPHDEQADGPALGDTIGFLDGRVKKLLKSPTLRPPSELEWAANLTLAVHWRLRNFTVEPVVLDFRSVAKECTWAHFPINDLKLKDGDVALRGKPIASASKQVFQECCSIARERHQAANWLIGTEEIYSEVSCDT